MRVRCFWRDCDFRNKKWDSEPVDAFWVEATEEEAVASVFPSLKPEQITESRQLAGQWHGLGSALGSPGRDFCFLVARDLSSIDPLHPHYPVHPMWNAYSPFRELPEVSISSLEELRTVALPPESETEEMATGLQTTDHRLPDA